MIPWFQVRVLVRPVTYGESRCQRDPGQRPPCSVAAGQVNPGGGLYGVELLEERALVVWPAEHRPGIGGQAAQVVRDDGVQR
jgi:hypothetical protein